MGKILSEQVWDPGKIPYVKGRHDDTWTGIPCTYVKVRYGDAGIGKAETTETGRSEPQCSLVSFRFNYKPCIKKKKNKNR